MLSRENRDLLASGASTASWIKHELAPEDQAGNCAEVVLTLVEHLRSTLETCGRLQVIAANSVTERTVRTARTTVGSWEATQRMLDEEPRLYFLLHVAQIEPWQLWSAIGGKPQGPERPGATGEATGAQDWRNDVSRPDLDRTWWMLQLAGVLRKDGRRSGQTALIVCPGFRAVMTTKHRGTEEWNEGARIAERMGV